MADNSTTEPNLGEELQELKLRMNEIMRLMTNHLKMKGQEGTSAPMIASVPLLAVGSFIEGPSIVTEPIYGMSHNMMPMSFQTAHGIGSSTSIPFPNPIAESLRVTIPPPPNVVVNEAAILNPNVNQPNTKEPFKCSPTFAPNHGKSFNPDEGLNEEIKKDRERVKMMEKRQSMMEEQLRHIQDSRVYGPTRIKELSFATHLDIPKDFKVPEFDKYDRTSNPRIHLMSYYTKMGVWSKDERFFMHFFPKSLTGLAVDWYWRLKHSQIHSWSQLATLFLRQYSFNESFAPIRTQLEAMRKVDNESFKKYAQK
ncbi:hypothetical protein L6164_001224 [Bauhinia variegata]|uniref:Uncharacterized protein n=1 Tax=Bauhinia variegata TaxID=167791 RepID=A0ACB9Q902_BAUVA|nr:hypothetical protein L6164_001224 [Bauhinia variegata]